MIRTKGEAGTGGIVNAVTMRAVSIRGLQGLREEELYAAAKEHRAPYELVRWVAENGRLPVVTFTAGGIATPADAALCMQLGADGVFVGSGIFKSGDPDRRAKAIVEATTHFNDPRSWPTSAGLGEPMVGISASTLPDAGARSARLVGPCPELHLVAMIGGLGSVCSPCARFASTARVAPRRRGRRRGASPGAARRARRARDPGRRVDDDREAGLALLDEAIRSFDRPVFGTCAGMILVDRAHLGLADLEVDRNAYGRQVASFEADLELDGDERPFRGVFIRAPRVREAGPDVEVLAELDGEPVLLRDGRVLVAAFHPELTDDPRVTNGSSS